MKVRIKKVTYKNDKVTYYPQYRNWLGFWFHFKDFIYEADGYYIHGFKSHKEAEEFLIEQVDLELGTIEEKVEYCFY